MNGKVGAPKATKEVTVAVEEEVEKLQCEGGGWDAALAMLTDAGDLITGGNLARNDWYRLRRALEIIKVFFKLLKLELVVVSVGFCMDIIPQWQSPDVLLDKKFLKDGSWF